MHEQKNNKQKRKNMGDVKKLTLTSKVEMQVNQHERVSRCFQFLKYRID